MNIHCTYSSNARHALFRGQDSNNIYVWGAGDCLGNKDSVDHVNRPQLLPLPPNPRGGSFEVRMVATGSEHTLLLTTDNQLLVWGCNGTYGQLGLPDKGNTFEPTLLTLPTDQKITQVCCGTHFSVVLLEDGSLFLWGSNNHGQIGMGEKGTSQRRPTHLVLPEPVAQVACGWEYSMVITKEKKLYGWGWNYRELLTSRLHGEEIKKPFLMASGVKDVACGWGHRLAFKEDGMVVGWGWNERGQLGLGHTDSRVEPEEVRLGEEAGEEGSRGRTIVGLVANSDQSYLVAGDGRLWAMGDTTNGRLGTGLPQKQSLAQPTLIEGLRVTLPMSENWGILFRWIFLAWKDGGSEFRVLPVEAIFHFVSVIYSE